MNYMYEVTITQHIKYSDTIKGRFADLTVVQQFVETVLNHFDKVDVSIAVVPEEDKDDCPNS